MEIQDMIWLVGILVVTAWLIRRAFRAKASGCSACGAASTCHKVKTKGACAGPNEYSARREGR